MPSTREHDRLQALARYQILDSEPEQIYDRIAALLARLLDVPHACVSFVDRDRVWFKSAHGLNVSEVDRQPGFCHTVVETGEVTHYVDATQDDRSLANELAQGEGAIRFYVGAPLETDDGFRIGTLCAFAPVARDLSTAERQFLVDLADLVMHEIELRRTRNQLERTEAVLRRSQRLESIGLVASGVAHDFNNLLGGIIGNIGLLKLKSEGSGATCEIMDEIEVVALRAAELSRQVLAYAGREGGPEETTVDFNEIIREMSCMIDSITHESVSLHTDLDPELPPVAANSTAIRQVVMNLITNASDAYRGEQGIVCLSTSVSPLGNVTLEVADNGMGMDQVTRDRILEAFFTTKVGGRGLGMAVVGRIVQQLGGSIDISSTEGVGTKIRIELPRSDEPAGKSSREGDDSSEWRASGTVLVVDDEKVILKVAQRTLALVGLDVLTAESGVEAMRQFEEHREDVVAVIIDLSMPVMDGGEVMLAIRAICPTVPIIIASGHSEHDVAERIGGHHLEGFLEKPFSPRAMIRAVRAVL